MNNDEWYGKQSCKENIEKYVKIYFYKMLKVLFTRY